MPYLAKLIEGYRRFRDNGWARSVSAGPSWPRARAPQIMIMACADSRVDPAQIFDAGPGEIFVVRNIAALAPPYETTSGYHGVSAALEFAVTQLEVGEILVMGHGLCGGCAAALTGAVRGHAAGRRPFHRRLGADAERRARRGPRRSSRDGPRRLSRDGAGGGQGQPRQFAHLSVDRRAGACRTHPAPRRLFREWRTGILYVLDEAEGTFRPA